MSQEELKTAGPITPDEARKRCEEMLSPVFEATADILGTKYGNKVIHVTRTEMISGMVGKSGEESGGIVDPDAKTLGVFSDEGRTKVFVDAYDRFGWVAELDSRNTPPKYKFTLKEGE